MTNAGKKKKSANNLQPSSNYLVLHAPAASSVHHTRSPLSSRHPALCLLCGEEGGAPHLLTTRPAMVSCRQSDSQHGCVSRLLHSSFEKEQPTRNTKNSLVQHEWRRTLAGRTWGTARRGILTSSGLFPYFLTLLTFWDFPNKVVFHKQYGMGKESIKIS